MALIKCPDCGKMFSVYAECCPDCGCPTKDAKAANIVNDSPIPEPTEEVGSNEQALSIIDEKSVEGKTELQQDLQPSTEEDESIVEEKNPNRKWLWCVGIMAVLLVGFIIAYNSFGSQKKHNETPQEEIAQMESSKEIAGNAFTEPRTYTYKTVWEEEIDDDDGRGEASESVTIKFSPNNSVRIEYEVQEFQEWEGTYSIEGQTITINVQPVYVPEEKEVITAKLEGDKLVLDNNNVCGIVLLKRNGLSGQKDEEQELFGLAQYIFQNLPDHKSIEEVDHSIFSPTFLAVLEKANSYWDMLAASDDDVSISSIKTACLWYRGNECDSEGKLVRISVPKIKNDKAQLKIVYKNSEEQEHIMKLVRINDQWYCDDWDSKKEDLLRVIEQVENNSTSDIDTEQRMELIRNHEWGDNMLHHHLVGTMSDETGKHPIELDFDYCNIESGTIENAIYKNVKLGGRIKMNGEVTRGGLLIFSGKDGNQNFTIRIDPSNLEGESFVGEKHLTVSLMPQCNHGLAQ